MERLLEDNEIGWQAGNWDINCRSVAICFDGDYENSKPSDIELKAAANIIKEYYPGVLKERIFGHCEINRKTTCPSNLFLSMDSRRGWKEELLAFRF
jgi:N-acetyl-anhydromuramyl-L-alanine amidase AmpD